MTYRRLPMLVLFMLLLVATAAPAIDVTIVNPTPDELLLGEIGVEVAVTSEHAISRVELWLDGQLQQQLEAPPFSFTMDVGEALVSHQLEVIATDSSGARASAELHSLEIPATTESLELSLQAVYLTITGKNGQRILDLGRDELRLLDNGVQQEIFSFGRGDIPFTAVLLIDASESMVGRPIREALDGARLFIDGMQPLDEAAVYICSDQLLAATPMAAGEELLLETLDRAEVLGGTAVYDHLFLALRAVERRLGRRVVILLSDGEDIHSVLRREQMQRVARRSQALLYWIHLGGLEERNLLRVDSWHDAREHERQLRVLRTIVEESGGRVLQLDHSSGIGEALSEILAELREQYALGFYPSDDRNDGSWHEIGVEVDRSDAIVRTKEGYLDY